MGELSPVLNSVVPLQHVLSQNIAASDHGRSGLIESMRNYADKLDLEFMSTSHKLQSLKSNIEIVRTKHEDMDDLTRTLEQLKISLEDHIKAVLMNEGSFKGAASVLEYDDAKSRTNVLLKVIHALSQMDRAREALSEGADDQQKLYDSLVDMQESRGALIELVGDADYEGADQLESLKDRFLSWQSAALVFAIKQANFQQLEQIQVQYESLGRKNDFETFFRHLLINEVKEIEISKSTLMALVNSLVIGVNRIYEQFDRVVSRFLTEGEKSLMLEDSIKEGLAQLEVDGCVQELISSAADPVALLRDTCDNFAQVEASTSYNQGSVTAVISRVSDAIMSPFFSAALKSFFLAYINKFTMDGTPEHWAPGLLSVVEEITNLIRDSFESCTMLSKSNLNNVLEEPVNVLISSLVSKLSASSVHKGCIKVADIIPAARVSSAMLKTAADLKKEFVEAESTFDPDFKPFNSWNRTVVEAILKFSFNIITDKMNLPIAEFRNLCNVGGTEEKEVSSLPSFSIQPNGFVTVLGQDLLQMCHEYEQYLVNDSFSYAFFCAFKKKYRGDDLFKKVVGEIANRAVTYYLRSAGKPESYRLSACKQFLVDTCFLKDAMEDLRVGNTEVLTDLENKLRNRIAQLSLKSN